MEISCPWWIKHSETFLIKWAKQIVLLKSIVHPIGFSFKQIIRVVTYVPNFSINCNFEKYIFFDKAISTVHFSCSTEYAAIYLLLINAY